MGPMCNHKHPYERRGIGQLGKTQKREMETEIGVMQPQAKECQLPPDPRKGTGRNFF